MNIIVHKQIAAPKRFHERGHLSWDLLKEYRRNRLFLRLYDNGFVCVGRLETLTKIDWKEIDLHEMEI
jgi:hypothetical protein